MGRGSRETHDNMGAQKTWTVLPSANLRKPDEAEKHPKVQINGQDG